jgi:hypothetical protein
MTINQLTNAPKGAELQSSLVESIDATNSVLAGCNVHFLFRGSTIDNQTGLQGLRWAIMRVLSQAADTGLTCEEIIDIIRSSPTFAVAHKYPGQTYADNISNVLIPAGQVVATERDALEDSERNSEKFIAMRIRRNEWNKKHGKPTSGLYVKQGRKLYFPIAQDS